MDGRRYNRAVPHVRLHNLCTRHSKDWPGMVSRHIAASGEASILDWWFGIPGHVTHASVVQTFEVVAGSWGSGSAVSAPAVCTVMG